MVDTGQTKKVSIPQRDPSGTCLGGRKNLKAPVSIEQLYGYEVRSWEQYGLQDICGSAQLMHRAYIAPVATQLI